MNILESLDNSTSNAAEKGEAYLKTTKKYYELKVFQQVSILSSAIVKLAIYGSLFVLGLIFLVVSGASALSEYLDSVALGYLIAAGFIFVLAGIVYLCRKVIDRKVIKKLSKNFFEE